MKNGILFSALVILFATVSAYVIIAPNSSYTSPAYFPFFYELPATDAFDDESLAKPPTPSGKLKYNSQNPCLDLKKQRNDFKKQALKENKVKYEQVKKNPGATQYEKDQAEGNMRLNFEDAIEEEMLKTKIKICEFKTRIANQNQAARNGNLETTLQCYEDLLKKQQKWKVKIKNVDVKYPNQYHKQRLEKRNIFLKEVAAEGCQL